VPILSSVEPMIDSYTDLFTVSRDTHSFKPFPFYRDCDRKLVYVLRLARPTNPIRPEPNSQIAAGMGTDGTNVGRIEVDPITDTVKPLV